MRYFLRDNFYLDIDHANQLRITGPENHLFCGLGFSVQTKLEVIKCELEEGQLSVSLSLDTNQSTLHIPLVTDIRTLRQYTEPIIPTPLYQDLAAEGHADLLPQSQEWSNEHEGETIFTILNRYSQDDHEYYYGCQLRFASEVKVSPSGSEIKISGTKPIRLQINTVTNLAIETPLSSSIFKEQSAIGSAALNPFLMEIFEQAGREIDHLVRTKKTSSFEYGTIFPRDWIEAADLGEDDFSLAAIDYMYEQAMKYVSDKGEGWHEEVIGQYKTRVEKKKDLIDRKMIDIEPHYLLGIARLSPDFLTRPDIHDKFKLIAQFVVTNALQQELISFKRLPEIDGYYLVGNWRDSEQAFPNQKSPLSPYDVNCVFYPEALRVINAHREYLDQEDEEELDTLIAKWDLNKQKYRLYHDRHTLGYALALHGKKNLPLPISHLDESYDLFYNRPSIEEVDSFARKLIDPDYFYTPAGPLLVAADSDQYSSKQYHGQVIWPKQAAFAVAGLARQLRYGQSQEWPEVVLENARVALLKTAEACFNAWQTLGSIPELYYYDEIEGRARFYTDQENYEGQMSLVQLWSAVGARRIIREYITYRQSQ